MTIPELLMLAVGFIIDPEGFERANRIARQEMIDELRAEEANDR